MASSIPSDQNPSMAILVGVLLDVSYSMKASIGKRPNGKYGSWARSIFGVVDSLIKHDVSSSNHVFALGFGASKEPHIFDLLGTVMANAKKLLHPHKNQTKAEIVDELVIFLMKDFDHQYRVDISRDFKGVLMEVLTKKDACFCMEELKHNSHFKKILPSIICQSQADLRFECATGSLQVSNRPPMRVKNANEVSSSLTVMILEELLTFLEKNGAPRVRKWANMNVLLDVVKLAEARSFLEVLRCNVAFRRRFVTDCLPETCRKVTHDVESYSMDTFNFVVYCVAPSRLERATREIVKDVVEKGKKLMEETKVFKLMQIDQEAIINVHEASKILHGGIGEDGLTDERVDELMAAFEPLIYGGTPMMTAIGKAKTLFATKGFEVHKKLIFIISDGMPEDRNAPFEELSRLGVTTVCCYITKNDIDDPKHLYSTECDNWDQAAKLMFRMSSAIKTQDIPRTLFVKHGWTIDITNNETHLFAQVNHPDVIEDVCNLARDVVCCQDALSDLLARASLDPYINQANQGFHPKKQVGGTCYANASAAVLHLSMQRIVGREGGYPDFFKLREEMIQKYGQDGANTFNVLEEVCPQYRLRCKVVDTIGAMKAITAKRPVLARFRLTDSEWDIFGDFYKKNPRGILTSDVLNIKEKTRKPKTSGHAVVLTSFNSECLTLMNSWGSSWADGGFFKIANAEVLGLEFVDVFWTLKDLLPSEIEAYNRHGPSIAQEMFSKLQGLQKMEYLCPFCLKRSNVNDFSGNHLEAKCPRCHQEFKIKEAGDDLALNMYLLSLTSGRK